MENTGQSGQTIQFDLRTIQGIIQTMEDVSGSINTHEIIDKINRYIQGLLHADASLIARLEAVGDQVSIIPAASSGSPVEAWQEFARLFAQHPLFFPVISQAAPFHIYAETADLDTYSRGLLDSTGFQHLTIIPVLREQTPHTLICAGYSRAGYIIPANDLLLMRLFLSQVASTMENLRLLNRFRQYNNELETIYQASLSLTASLELPRVLQAILESAFHLVHEAKDTHIFLYENDRLSFGAAQWASGQVNVPWSNPRPDGLTYTVARSGKPVIVKNMRTHPLFKEAPKEWSGSIMGLPLKIGERVVGVMTIAGGRPRQFTEQEVRSVRLLADQAAIAIENARLHRLITDQALTDVLTGLPNRRSFDARLEEELRRAGRYHHPFAVIMLDLNDFKKINDSYGHLQGDNCLSQFGCLLSNSIRDTDFVARFGGDEFAILLPETDRATAQSLLDRLGDAMRAQPFISPDGRTNVLTACSGIAIYPEDGQEALALIGVADEGLYGCKRGKGVNRE